MSDTECSGCRRAREAELRWYEACCEVRAEMAAEDAEANAPLTWRGWAWRIGSLALAIAYAIWATR